MYVCEKLWNSLTISIPPCMYVTRTNGFPSFTFICFCLNLLRSFTLKAGTMSLSACVDDSSIVNLGMVFMLPTLRNPVQGLTESLHMNNGLETVA